MTLVSTISLLLWIHIAAGFLAFFVAPIALLTAKGGKTHRRWGKVYFWAMAVVTATALVIALYRPILFLALVAVFSFYSAFSGYRVLFRKRPQHGEKAQAMDWVAAFLVLGASLALLALGLFQPSAIWRDLRTVALVFGAIGTVMALADMREFRSVPGDKNFWWYGHLARMIGSYIAAVTAFAVVNLTMLPELARWLAPTLVGAPVIAVWTAYYKRKFNRRREPTAGGITPESAKA